MGDRNYPLKYARLIALSLTLSIAMAGGPGGIVDGQVPQPRQDGQVNVISESEIKEARKLLDTLGYWLIVDVQGLDASLRHALIAFQKIEGLPRTGILTKEELEVIRQARRPAARDPEYAHIEVDLSRQVLFVVDDEGVVTRILPVSTGSGELFTEGGRTRRAITPTGRFTVSWKIEGWRKSPLGLLYYPNYIYDGIAIHGNPSVPPQPVSHGCIRIPMFASKEFYRMAAIGTIVLVYDNRQPAPLAALPLPDGFTVQP
ncbi:MAG: murein L,D-transpeptidase [Blastocatellia bacterium]|nr:murein L,D-transpeptidase [Blastocatellia bacterium]